MSDGIYRPELNITNYESKFREMDPKTEDLIDGDQFEDGMRVLIADSIMREDTRWIDAPPSDYRLDRAKECNRWCTVSRVQRTFNGTFSFFATYDDGTKRKRTYATGYTWFVKLDSLPKKDENGNEKGCCIDCWHIISKTCGDSKCVCHDPARNSR